MAHPHERSARTLLSRAGLRGAAVEAAWITAHVATYPLGFLAERGRRGIERYSLTDLPPHQRGLLIGDVEAAGTPILLLHGMIDNRSIFAVLRRSLRRRGFGQVHTMNYSPLLRDVREAAHQLALQVERVCLETGYERLHIVGHSLGGIIARYYVQRMGGDERVHTLVTMGSPHGGTQVARILPRRVSRQLLPGSRLLRELAAPAPECRTRFLAFYTDLDQCIAPMTSARIEHPDLKASNVFVRGVGHLSLPIHGPVVHAIGTALAHLDHDGSTRRHGVTRLPQQKSGPRPQQQTGDGSRSGSSGSPSAPSTVRSDRPRYARPGFARTVIG